MSAAIEAFKRLVITYFRNVKAGGVECRLVIPGLTPSLSINLHELLKSEDLPSVLVVPRSTPPSREHGLIHAEGLTSIRQGDMLIVTCPGELSKLQDGISGAGGAIRNFAVSDEWPWIDDGNEYFRFRTMFLRELFKLWSVGQSDKKWLNSVAKSLVTSSQASLDRAALLLEDVLGSFSPSLYGDLPTVREKFLFHAGLPRPAGDVLTSDADQFIEQLNDLSKLVRRARVEQDFRGDVLSRIDRLESDPAKQELLVSQVNALLDGLAINAERQYSGALVLRGCWTGDVLRWSSLTIDRLISLFSPVAGSSKLQMKVKLTVKSGLLSPDERSAVIFENSDLSFTVSVDGLSEPDLKSAVVRIVQGSRNIIPETPITICRDTIILNVAYRDVFPRDSKKSRTIRVQMSIGGVIQIEVPVKVTACFHDSPLVVVSDPGFKVIAGKSQAQDDESVWESIETTGNVSLTAVTFDSMETVDVSVEQNPVSLEIDGEDARIRRLSRVIDPSVSPSGRYGVVIESDSAICRVEIEASTAERGEFTLERELIVRLAEGNKARLTKLVEVFVGSTSEAYPYLGGLSDATRARSSLIEAFESGSGGGLPVLADLFGGAPAVLPSLTGMVWVWGHVQSGRLGIFNPSSEITEILDLYFQARRKVVFEISQGVPPPEGRWPAYAWYPTFVDKRRNIIESALVGYLEQFIAVNDFLVKKGAELRWEDAFLLANLDRVVHWAGASESGRFSLVGPWHPLMIAKRFMTQETALASVRRFLANATNKSGIATNKLAILLDQIQAFRWIPMLSPDGVEFDHAYVSATSDPGWMAAISAEVLDKASTEIFVTSIRRSLGLSVTLLPVAQERMAAGFFRQFQNAHPTRRSISLSAEPIYSGDRLISSAEDFLYEGEELSASGRLLPGGLHLFLNEADGLRPIHWRDPPICVYKINEASSWQESYRDIHLLAPAKPRLSRSGGNEQPFARASGDKSVFAGAVHKITVGAGGVPRSFAYERDIRGRPERTIGDLFVSALNLQAVMAGPSRTAGWAIDLPENLKFRWNVIPGSQIDPAVLVHYSRTGFDVGESRVLWDYNMSLTGPASSYFVLSKVPESVTVALGGSPVLAGQGDGAKVIRELAEVGLAIGSESLQTGAKALGVIGTVAAIRLLKGWGDICGPITSSQRSRGFILPVDSFREILGAGLDVESVEGLDARRADLIAFRLSLNNDDHLFISFSAIECKYSSYSFSEEGAQSALEQAQRTYDRLLYLAELARSTSGIPERLALLHLISFGLRLNCAADDAGLAIDQLIIQKLIDGDYSIREPLSPAAVFITECLGKAPSWKKTSGLEVRVCPGHWPGVNDTPELVLLRQYLQGLLGRFAERQEPEKKNGVPSGTDVSSVKKSSVGSPPQSDEPVRAIGGDRMALPSLPTPGLAIDASRTDVSPSVNADRLSPILIGAMGEKRRVYFDPQSETRPLDNYNVMVSGSSGKGKTQLIKAFVAELRRQNRNVFMIDFKNDFASDRQFVALSRLSCRFVTFDGLPFNPLIPMPVSHPATGRQVLQISQYITGITSVLAKTFGLGTQQESDLKDVIRDCYRDCGLDPSGTVEYRPDAVYPDFNDVGNRLRQANPLAYNRMDPLFDLGVFSSASRRLTFETSLGESSVIDLSQIQSDAIKYAIAKILIISAHSYYNSRPHSPTLQQFFVFDEAHRVLDEGYLARFSRECRAYGVGLLLSSQNPADFPDEISASLNTKIIHGNGTERERVRDIIRTLGGALSEEEVAQLGLFDAFISNPHYRSQRFKTLAYPHYLVLEAIRKEEGVLRASLNVDGVVTNRLSIDYLVSSLISTGLVTEKNGVLYSVRLA